MNDPYFDRPYPTYQSTRPPTSNLAIASLVCALLGLAPLPGIGALLAIVLGHVALGEIRAQAGRLGGRGVAIAGLVLGYLEILAVLLFLAAIVALVGYGLTSMRTQVVPPRFQAPLPAQSVENRVIAILRESTGAQGEITRATSLKADLGFDELDSVEMVMELEDAFGDVITDSEAERLQTVGDVIDLILAKPAHLNPLPRSTRRKGPKVRIDQKASTKVAVSSARWVGHRAANRGHGLVCPGERSS
jgi:acyl carrier protein